MPSPRLIKKSVEVFNEILDQCSDEQIKLITACLESMGFAESHTTTEEDEEEEEEKPAKKAGKKAAVVDEEEDEVEEEEEEKKPAKKTGKKAAVVEEEEEDEDEVEEEEEEAPEEEEDEEEEAKPAKKPVKKPAKAKDEDEEDEDPGEDEEEDAEVDYSKMKLVKLKALSEERGLPTKTLAKSATPEKAFIKAHKAYDEKEKLFNKKSIESLIKIAAKNDIEVKMPRGRSSDDKKKAIYVTALLAGGVEI